MEHNWNKLVAALEGMRVEQAIHYTCRAPLFGPLHQHDRRFHISYVIAGQGRVEVNAIDFLPGKAPFDGRRVEPSPTFQAGSNVGEASTRLQKLCFRHCGQVPRPAPKKVNGIGVEVDRHAFDVGPGDVVFVRPRTPHRSIGDARTRYELIEIKFSVNEPAYEGAVPPIDPVTHVVDSASWVPALERLVAAHLVDVGADGWLARLRLAEVLLLLATGAGSVNVRNTVGDDTAHKMRQAEQHIALNYAKPLAVADLAGLVCMSESHFAACFKRVTGVSPVEQLIRTRLRHAKELLRDSTMSISQVGLVCGFHTPQYFCRLFRQRIGCSPREFRHQEA